MVRPQRSGFTLVELFVTLGVIGMLLSLLLVAMQQARSAARKAHCLNNIRQLALACHEFELAHGTLPKTANGHSGVEGAVYFLSPHVQLLPYLGQQPLYDTIDLDEPSPGHTEPPASSRNPHALAAFVPVFVCPADRLATGGATNYRACMGDGPGVIGQVVGQERENGNGVWRFWQKSRSAKITDGLSNTILFGEKLIGDLDPKSFTPWRDSVVAETSLFTIVQAQAACSQVTSSSGAHRSYGGTAWLFGGFQATWYNHVLPPNATVSDCGDLTGAFAARSFHPDGVNVVMADGAGRFIGSAIDIHVWRAMATRCGSEIISEF